MSIGLAAIALVAIFLPGYSFTLAYNKTFSNTDPAFPEYSRFSGRVVLSVVFACLFHSAAVPIANSVAGTTVDIEVVMLMISGTTDKDALSAIVGGVTAYPYQVLIYFLSVTLAAFAIGAVARKIVITNRLDIKYPALRLDSEWYYLLRGRDDEVEPAYVVVTVDVQHQGSTYLYTGILDRFWIDANGALERISLHRDVVRRKLEDDPDGTEKTTGRNYDIQGEYLVVWCSDIRTLNIDFFYEIEDATEDRSRDDGHNSVESSDS